MYTEAFSLVGANGTWTRNGVVRVIRYDSGDAGGMPPLLRVISTSGNKMDTLLRPGRTVILSEPVSGIILRNASGSANVAGLITFGDGSVTDDTVAGEVSIIDGEVSKSRQGIAFGFAAGVAGVAAQISYVEVWNPVGSGKRIILTDLSVSAFTASAMFASRTAAQLAGPGAGAPSKLAFGTPSTALCTGAAIAAVGGTVVETSLLAASVPYIRQYKQPHVLVPGSGFVIGGAVNTTIYGAVQFTEELI